MIQYILECIAFQLVFLIIYDLFLKRETFFQWNRFYLICTFVLSMIIPWVKIEAMKAPIPTVFQGYPEYLWYLDQAPVVVKQAPASDGQLSWPYLLVYLGMFLAALVFAYKLYQIEALKRSGKKQVFRDFTQYVIANSNAAFSFFKSIFLGDKILEKEHKNILRHELVHIRQKHSYDLLFFELMRIVGWFNPMVYLYQNRISELHEFIADAQVAKTNKKEQYQLLLSEVFQTQNISFINQFFKSSLIKKRIVMLTKEKSKQVWQLKYLLLVPIVMGMLMYTSCEADSKVPLDHESVIDDQKRIEQIKNELLAKDTEEIERQLKVYMDKMIVNEEILSKDEYFKFKALHQKAISTSKVKVINGDTLYFLGTSTPPKSPTYQEYLNYVNRTKAYKEIDQDLWVSIDPYEFAIRKIGIGDKNLSAGDFISVNNLRDLTADEIRSFNRKMETMDFNGRFLYLSDERDAYIITKIKRENLDGNSFAVQMDNRQKSDANEMPFAIPDQVPTFPGCENEPDQRACFLRMMQKHIRENFTYPKEAQEKGIQGRVNIFIDFMQNGTIITRFSGPDPLLENEVKRIMALLPQLVLGKNTGETLAGSYSIPITFN